MYKCVEVSKFESIPFYIYGEAIGDHLRSNLGIISRPMQDHLRFNLGIISGPGIICGPVHRDKTVYNAFFFCVIVDESYFD